MYLKLKQHPFFSFLLGDFQKGFFSFLICNCIRKENCPLNQNCLVQNVVYEATINSDLPSYQEKKYNGLCEGTFKKQFPNHKSSLSHKRYKNSTAFSKELWKVKVMNGTPSVNWRIVRTAKAYTPESKPCLLSL